MIWNMFRKLAGRTAAPNLTIVGAKSQTASGGKAPQKASRLAGLPRLGRRSCTWVSEGAKNASFTQYRCTTCGVEAFSRTGKAPRQCKRGVEGGL